MLGSGPVTIGPAGVLIYSATTSTARTFTLNGGAIQAGTGATVTYSGPIFGGYLEGTGTHMLAAGSSLTGTTTFGAATVNQTGAGVNLINFSNGGSFTNSASATWSGGLNQSSARLNVNSTLNASNWSSNGIITVSTTGNLNDSDSTLSLGGGSQTYVGSSSNPNTGGSITMTSGSTIALNGGLLINNGAIGAAGAGLVNINYDSLAKGAGNYAGGYSVNFGGKFQPGNSPGLVTSGSAVWNGGGSFTFQINNATGSAGTNWGVNNINGTLTIAATSTSPFGISVQSLTSGNAAGQLSNFDPTQSYQWAFINATGGISNFSPATIALDTSGFANSFNGVFGVSENNAATSLFVTYTPATLNVSGTVHWSGAVSNAWDVNTTQNWTASGSPTTYLQSTNGGQAVVFDDTATGNFNVNLTTALSPSSVTVTNSINTYTFSGAGKITGSASLVKTGTGTLIITTANDYTGGTTVSGGTLQIGDGTNSGALPGNTTNNAALAFKPGVNGIAVAGSIGGSGTIAILGANIVTFSGTNSYSGGTTITGGTLNINSDSALGAAAGVVNLNGGTLQFSATGGVTLNGSRNVVLGGGAFDTNGGNDSISGVISGSSAANSNLIKNGAGSLSVSNINTYAGSTVVNAGALTVLAGGSVGSGPLVVGNPNPGAPGPPTQSVLFLDNAAQTVGPLSGTIAQPGNGNTASIFLSS
jgi:fibronectin-binding autotransporter adhesin